MSLAVPIGILVGISLGALGGGGSILTVPALIYLLGQNAHGATTASLVIVGSTAIAGAIAHGTAGRVRFGDGLIFGALGIAGSFFGSRLSSGINSNILLVAFAVLMFLAAVAMLHRVRRMGQNVGVDADGDKENPTSRSPRLRDPRTRSSSPATTADGAITVLEQQPGHRRWLKVVAAATIVGLLTGFFGVGGGFIVVPALVLALRIPIPKAIGTSLVVIAINSVTALVSRVGTHASVDWRSTGVFVVMAVVGSLIGTRLAGRARPQILGATFGVLLVALSFYMVARSLPSIV